MVSQSGAHRKPFAGVPVRFSGVPWLACPKPLAGELAG